MLAHELELEHPALLQQSPNSTLAQTKYIYLPMNQLIRRDDFWGDWSIFIQGSPLSTVMECYGLPYGGLGFVSHFLTFYTIACLWKERKPLWPFLRVKYSKFDFILGTVGLLVSTAMTIRTVVQCRNEWPFVLIALWKLSTSIFGGITALAVAITIRSRRKVKEEDIGRYDMSPPVFKRGASARHNRGRYDGEKHGLGPLFAPGWMLLHIPCTLIGVVGLGYCISAMKFSPLLFAAVVKVVIGFSVGIGIALYLCLLAFTNELMLTLLPFSLLVLLALLSFLGDWALGLIMGNLVGVPTDDNSTFYWTYFIAKRLTLLSW
ncbi:hypothetical protein B0H34DRAFT_800435 [Crassisporium funariophilum]|nr:hypothetical protein B0H34DRAFT_800435 [Crassisporium funariophilum]